MPKKKRQHVGDGAGDRQIEYHLDQIDAWRSGRRGTAGLPATGGGYAGRMLDEIARHERALIDLGHQPTIAYVRSHGLADGARGMLASLPPSSGMQVSHKKTSAQIKREIAKVLAPKESWFRRGTGSDVTAEDLSPTQRTLIRALRRAREYHGPLSVTVSSEGAARQLAELGLLHIEPSHDLGLTWVTFTDLGRDVAIAGKLWG